MPAFVKAGNASKSAIRNSGFEFPLTESPVNLAPADVRKAGTAFDLPIALGILAAQGIVERREIADVIVLGELSLDGTIQPAAGCCRSRRLPAAKGSRAFCSQAERERGGDRLGSTCWRSRRSPKLSSR